jgi:hypothetical protein
LGNYATQEAAATALKTLVNSGVRAARLEQFAPAMAGYRLRLPTLANQQSAALAQIKAVLPDNSLQSCNPTAPQ